MAKGFFSWLGFGKKQENLQEQNNDEQLKLQEEAKVAAENAKAEEEARIAAEKAKAEEEARIAAEKAKAEEEARIAAEKAKAEEEARIAAEKAKAEEEARIAAEKAKAEEEARIAAEKAKAEEEAKVAEEKEKVDEISLDKEDSAKVKKSFFERLKKTRENLAYGLSALIVGKKIDEDLYEDLETALLTADLGVDTTEYVINKLKEESKARDLHDANALKANLKKILIDILKPCEVHLKVEKKEGLPFVILMVGVNGAGKTTTIGKLAMKFKSQGLKVMLGAGDTFRAAAVEQLKEWGNRTDVPVISQPTGSDSASVLFDALSSAKSKNVDVLICDTAGRLQNKDNLMEELKKIVRVMKKISDDVPHEVLLVLDAATGQNAVSQTKLFSEAVNVTGLCLTKLDGTAKGGVVFALADKYQIPVRFVGIGEKTEDLRVFDVDNFVDALIGDSL